MPGSTRNRHSDAVVQLRSRLLTVRLRGIHDLERLAAQRPGDRAEIVRILGAFTRARSAPSHRWVRTQFGRSGRFRPAADVQAAATALGRLAGNGYSCDLTGAYLCGAILPGAGFGQANFTGAGLPDADLTGADLTGAVLADADLTGSDLTGCDLTGADLTGADLRGAVLIDTIMADAVLVDAHLAGADLSNACLHGATLRGARLRGAYLNRATFLDTGAHVPEPRVTT